MATVKKNLAVSCVTMLVAVSFATGHSLGSDASDEGSKTEACIADPTCQRSSWKEEFERLCSQTAIATTFKPERLRTLISDSDKLMAQLETLPDSGAKIYLFRLRGCRDFFIYALELQGANGKAAPD